MIHPLLINHIVCRIFGYVERTSGPDTELSNVLSCRLVCQTWNEMGTVLVRSMLKDHQVQFTPSDPLKLHKFMEAMKHSRKIPYSRFSIEPEFFTTMDHLEVLCDLFRTIGPFLIHLNLTFNQGLRSSHYWLEKLHQLHFDQLKSLSINFKGSTSNTAEGQQSNIFMLFTHLAVLFKKSSALDSLALTSNLPEEACLFESFTNTNERLAKFISKSLQYICSLNLQVLHLEILASVVPLFLFEFLSSQSRTLRELTISSTQIQELLLVPVIFPVLSKLNVLLVTGGKTLRLEFMKSFPSLISLRLFSRSRARYHLKPDKYPHLSLQELSLECGELNKEIIHDIAKTFPGVMQLQLKINATGDSLVALTTVFQMMGRVERLELQFPDACKNIPIDTILTGIPVEICRSMLEKQDFHDNLVDSFGRRLPNLSDLKNLRKLEIHAHPYAVVLTDVSVKFGILQVLSLERLETQKFNISKKYFDKLKLSLIVKETKNRNANM